MQFRTVGMVVVLGAAAAQAKMEVPTTVPLDRLMKNTRAAIKEKPKDPQPHYVLGRLLTLKYVGRTGAATYTPEGKPPKLEEGYLTTERPIRKAELPAAVLEEAVGEFKLALTLDPEHAMSLLAMGWVALERDRLKPDPARRLEALGLYQRAFKAIHSEEAAAAILGLYQVSPPQTDEAKREVAELKAWQKKQVEDGWQRPMSPIVVLLDGSRALAPAIASSARVTFDLDARRTGREWPWLRPQAGLLVWDPERSARIASGEQLFGNISWYVVWRDGYEPLAALDDDRDGTLTGPELAGLRVWIDDGDGRSTAAEVHDLAELGVVRIAARSGGVREGVAWNADGVTLKDGRTLATFDWTPTSHPPLRAER